VNFKSRINIECIFILLTLNDTEFYKFCCLTKEVAIVHYQFWIWTSKSKRR
jgi:hypothetical protein